MQGFERVNAHPKKRQTLVIQLPYGKSVSLVDALVETLDSFVITSESEDEIAFQITGKAKRKVIR